MLIGYVSDEMHIAIADAQLEFRRADRSVELRSRASGAVHGDLEPGDYDVVVAAPGHTRKQVTMTVDPAEPYRFRLLSDRLLGYAWPKWARSGETCELRIHAQEPFHASLWRYGWTKEQVADLGLFDDGFAPGANRQILPDGDFTVGGARWNDHGYAFPPDERHHLVAPQRSGLYYVHLNAHSGDFFSFPLVVAPAEPTSDVAVLASNLDWNAYNDFGGRSNYVAAGALPLEPAVNVRQSSPFLRDTGARFWDREDYAPLSLDRPEPVNRVEQGTDITDPLERIGEEHVAPGTWRLLGWLERERFAYDFYAETQLHSGALDLDRYRVLILDQHPEYWSRQMYERVKDWVYERGGRLMYLGGNGISCEVEFATDTALVHRNGDLSEWLPTRSFTGGPGSVLPSRFSKRVESEARLLGVATTLTGMGTGAPYQVCDASHWAFEGTGLRDRDLFGERSLDRRNPGGASGHETDKMNEFTPPGTRLLAKGTNDYGGGGEMIHYETSSGGQVFSVGSICYVASLPVDDLVSQVTANVLRRFRDGPASR